MITISEVKITLLTQPSKVKAFASVTLNNELVLTGFKVIQGSNKLFVGNPSEKRNEEYKDTVFPITKDFREYLNRTVLEAYEAKKESQNEIPNTASEYFEDHDMPF